MRRNLRPRNNDSIFKNLVFWTGLVLLIAVVAFGVTYAIYNNKVKNQVSASQLNAKSIGELVSNVEVEDVKSASASVDKTVEEVKEIMEEEKQENKDAEEKIETSENDDWKKFIDKKTESASTEIVVTPTPKKELSFKMPVEGEILREYAKDNLVYSDTLKEWVTHTGIDIKANKTTIVRAAEAGVVKSIKNDPRYGTTVTIEHDSGFKTVYANLLTAEFISEKEEVKQGQSIGTVGSSASFEVADFPHLHFEIWKDGEVQDPNIYLK